MGVEYRHYLLPQDRTYALAPDRAAQLVETLRTEHFVLAPEHPAFASQFGDGAIHPYLATGGHAFRTIENPHAPRYLKTAEAAIAVPSPVTPEWFEANRGGPSADALHDELALAFPVNVPDDQFDDFTDIGLRYPFTFGADEALYHEIVLHLTRDYVHHSAEGTDRIDTRCGCGEDLGYEPDEAGKLWLAIRNESRIHARCERCGRPFDFSGRHAERTDGYTGERLPPSPGGAAYRFGLIVDCGKGWPRDRGPLRLDPAFAHLVASVLGEPIVDFGEFY